MKLDGKKQHKIRMDGKSFHFANLSNDIQKSIMERLAEKGGPVEKAGRSGILPGIKIDGKIVTKENLHEFEIKEKLKTVEKVKEIIKKVKKPTKKGAKGGKKKSFR